MNKYNNLVKKYVTMEDCNCGGMCVGCDLKYYEDSTVADNAKAIPELWSWLSRGDCQKYSFGEGKVSPATQLPENAVYLFSFSDGGSWGCTDVNYYKVDSRFLCVSYEDRSHAIMGQRAPETTIRYVTLEEICV